MDLRGRCREKGGVEENVVVKTLTGREIWVQGMRGDTVEVRECDLCVFDPAIPPRPVATASLTPLVPLHGEDGEAGDPGCGGGPCGAARLGI